MSESLGMILKKLRKEQEIGQKDLCRGIERRYTRVSKDRVL